MIRASTYVTIGRVRRNWFVRDYPLKKKKRRKNVDDWKLTSVRIVGASASVIAFGADPELRTVRPPRFARERIMENAFSMYRQHEETLLQHPRCLMQTRATRCLARSGLKHPVSARKSGKVSTGAGRYCTRICPGENFTDILHYSFHCDR